MLIEIEDAIANALIELKTRENIDSVSIIQAEHYAGSVVRKLREQGIDAKFYTDRNKFIEFKTSYSEYFTIMETENGVICFLNEGIMPKDLIVKFRGYLSVEALLAFIDDEIVLETLLIPRDKKKQPTINNQKIKKQRNLI